MSVPVRTRPARMVLSVITHWGVMTVTAQMAMRENTVKRQTATRWIARIMVPAMFWMTLRVMTQAHGNASARSIILVCTSICCQVCMCIFCN